MKIVRIAGSVAAALAVLVLSYWIYAQQFVNPRVMRELLEDPDGERARIVMLLTLPSGLAIRERIAMKRAEWKRAVGEKSFKRHFKLGGESLLRPPRGFDKEHELIDDIKRKSFMGIRNLQRVDALSPQFQRKVETSFQSAEPFMRFLCKSVGVPF